jgi:hypothetical protein
MKHNAAAVDITRKAIANQGKPRDGVEFARRIDARGIAIGEALAILAALRRPRIDQMEDARTVEGENFLRKVTEVNADFRDYAAPRHLSQDKFADLLSLGAPGSEAQSP